VHQQLARRAQRRALQDILAQTLDRRQRLAARADDGMRRDVRPQGRDLGTVERKAVQHIVDDGDQRVIGDLDAGRARALVQRGVELVGQAGVLAQPAFAGRVRQVEVQPDELARLRRGHPAQGVGCADGDGGRHGGRHGGRRGGCARVDQESPHKA
jgi:hypothetical protein